MALIKKLNLNMPITKACKKNQIVAHNYHKMTKLKLHIFILKFPFHYVLSHYYVFPCT